VKGDGITIGQVCYLPGSVAESYLGYLPEHFTKPNSDGLTTKVKFTDRKPLPVIKLTPDISIPSSETVR